MRRLAEEDERSRGRVAPAALLACALLAAGCGGGERQGADEPEGEFAVEVVEASFPERQHIAAAVRLRLTVRNADDETLDNVAVTVETKPDGDNAPLAFGRRADDRRLADPGRPVWILDEGPEGSAYVNTFNAGTLGPGERRELTWRLVPVRAGSYTVDYRVSPGLTGRARAASERARGSFEVTISDDPAPARVREDGEVVRRQPGGD